MTPPAAALPPLLYVCTAAQGGIAAYAHAQTEALVALGVEVTLLTPPGFSPAARGVRHLPVLLAPPAARAACPRWRVRLATAWAILGNAQIVAEAIRRQRHRHVLLATYSEYLAPLWAWKLRALARSGVRFGAVAHDPVRDYVVGPLWWHRLSIAEGYSYLERAYLHEPISLDTGRPMPSLRVHELPHGPYATPLAQRSPLDVRRSLKIPAEARLWLSFGHLRDGKNLPLVLEALRDVPDDWLLVAGSEATAGQTTSDRYRALAQELGVADRCRWLVDYLSDELVSDLFQAADAVLLTYSARFRSASGVLNLAVHHRRPVLASAGASALGSSVDRFRLGLRLPPDDAGAIREGMMRLFSPRPAPLWKRYELSNSWAANAAVVGRTLLADPDDRDACR